MKGDNYVSSKTESATSSGRKTSLTNGGGGGSFRQRSNTFTRDEPTVLRQTAVA